MEKNLKKCITNTLSFCYISEVNAILQTNYSFIFWKFVVAVLGLIAQSCPTVWNPIDCNPPGSSVHGDSPGKITGVGCHTFFQRTFPTQSLNPGLPHCRQFIYHLSDQGSPRIVEQEAQEYWRGPLLQGSSLPRNWTGVSCIAGGFFTSWATGEA